MAKELTNANKDKEDLGLSQDEISFYDALIENESAVREMENETLKLIAQELTQKLRANVKVDWQKRESVRAKMRHIIRITLKRYKYPPDNQIEAVELVMKQTEVLSHEWSLAS
jgi:type I restriction enzyme R subunit